MLRLLPTQGRAASRAAPGRTPTHPLLPTAVGCPRVPCSLRGAGGWRGSLQPGQEGGGTRTGRVGPCSLLSHAVLRLLPTATPGPASPAPPGSPCSPHGHLWPWERLASRSRALFPSPPPPSRQPRPAASLSRPVSPLSGPPSLPASSVPQPFLLAPAGPPSSIGRSSRRWNIKTLAICASIRETMSLAKGTFSSARMVSMLMCGLLLNVRSSSDDW